MLFCYLMLNFPQKQKLWNNVTNNVSHFFLLRTEIISFSSFSKKRNSVPTLEFVCPLSRIARVEWLPARWTKVVQGTGAIGDPRPADWTVFYCHRARKIDPGCKMILLRGTRGTVERGKRKRTRKKRAARG